MRSLSPPSRSPLARLGLLAAALLTISGALLASSATPASAARSIQQSPGFYCENAVVKVSPPRVYATAQPEQVLWRIGIQRWDASRQQWYAYKTTDHLSTFDYYGRSLTSWGIQFVNSRLNVSVYHQGFYRVASTVVASGGGTSAVLVGGGQYCQVW